MKVVLDTNLFVSSLLSPESLPANLIRVWQTGGFEIILSPTILSEIHRVLGYDHIRHQFPITDQKVDIFIQSLERHATIVAGVTDVTGAVPDDPDDEIILACAIDGEALLILSRDKHLLQLQEYAGIPIIRARQFWDRFGFWAS